MVKKEKFYYGIFEDGISLKVAQLRANKGQIQIVSLEQTQMEKSIYADDGKKKKKKGEDNFADRIASGEKITFDDLKGLDVTKQSKGSLDSIVSPHENLLSKFVLDFGNISFNANEKCIAKSVINQKITNLSYRKLSKLGVISKDEKKDRTITYGAIPVPNNSTEILVHRGENKLFYYLEKFNQSQYKTKFRYGVVDPNDISLINAVRLHYDFSENEKTFLLYLGNEYHQILVFEGNKFVQSVSIVIPANFFEIKEIVRSKLMLLHDEGELPMPTRLILAGEYSKPVDVAYFQEYYPNIVVEQFTCKDLVLDENSDLDSNLIAEFIIPISLAWKSANSNQDKFYQTNFLDKKIIERQKVFRVGWHGFVIVALIFGFSAISTRNILQVQDTIKTYLAKMTNLKLDLNDNEIFIKENESIYKEIESLKNSDNKTRSILHGKNKLSIILDGLSTAFSENPISWIKEFSVKDDVIKLYATTTKLENVIPFSHIFPEGNINFIKQEEISEKPVWSFEIVYSYRLVEEKKKDPEKKIDLAQTNKRNARNEYNEIVTLYSQKKWENALAKIDDFEGFFHTSSLLPNVHYLKGEIYYWRQDFTNAENSLKEALKLGGNLQPYAYLMLAKTLQKQGNITEAIRNLKSLKKEFPAHQLTETAQSLQSEWEENHE